MGAAPGNRRTAATHEAIWKYEFGYNKRVKMNILLTTYECMRRNVKELVDIKWQVLAIDENSDSQLYEHTAAEQCQGVAFISDAISDTREGGLGLSDDDYISNERLCQFVALRKGNNTSQVQPLSNSHLASLQLVKPTLPFKVPVMNCGKMVLLDKLLTYPQQEVIACSSSVKWSGC
ncbi:hypothetical protein M405DRAFT_863476 [Rhizopogon salebrosus TDB-379]|nr:hypothetical protein M405DRAFT_863476 [Rhizopogon salebrosus TDB-379]